MAWDTYTSFTQDTGVGNSWTDLGTISATTPRELISIVIGADNEHASTVTDALEVRVLVAIDDTPTNYTNSPVFAMSYKPSAVTQEWFGFTIAGWEDYKIQSRSAGTTNTYTVDGKWKGDGVSV